MTSGERAWNSALAAELRAERAKYRKMTMDDLAAASGIPKVSVERYLNDKRVIRVDVLAAMCAALGVSVGDLVTRAQTAVDAQRRD